ADLADTLLRVQDAHQTKNVHRARGSEKRLRYVLEQFIEEPAAKDCVLALAELQDLFGDLHDLQTLQTFVSKHVRRTSGEPRDSDHPKTLSDLLSKQSSELFARIRQN